MWNASAGNRTAAEEKAKPIVDELRRQRLVQAAELVDAQVMETLNRCVEAVRV